MSTISLSGAIVIGKNFWVQINTKRINFQATTTVIADVINGLLAALTATDGSVPDEFSEATWTSPSAGTITATGITRGNPLTISVGTDGAATYTITTTTSPTGPTWWSDANNWANGAVPITGDSVVIDNYAGDITDGLDQSGVTLASLTIGMSFTGTLGRPRTNLTGYSEYRDLYLKIGATASKIGTGSGQGSGRIKINLLAALTNCQVENSGPGADDNVPAVLLLGTHVSNVFDISGGTVGIAFFEDEASNALSLTVSTNGTCQCGSGMVHTNVISSGNLTSYSASTTMNIYSGTTTLLGTAAHADIDVRGGQLNYQTTGTATVVAFGPGTIDCQLDASPRTFGTTTMRAGGTINDPNRTITYTNKIAIDESVSSIVAA